MAETIKHTYQFKRGTAQRLREVNPMLRQGEPAFEYDTKKLKIGDGFTPYNSLPYVGSDIQTYQTFLDLPVRGSSDTLYHVVADKLMYQWVNDQYESLGASGSFDPSIITLINGGNANG